MSAPLAQPRPPRARVRSPAGGRPAERPPGPSGWLLHCVIVAVAVHALSSPVRADDAMVLPKGIFRVSGEVQHFFPIHERFGPDGDVEDVAVDFNRRVEVLF